MASITAVNDRTVYDSFMASYTAKYGTVNATFSSRKRPVFIRISHVYFSSCCSGILYQHTYPIAESPRYPYSLLPPYSHLPPYPLFPPTLSHPLLSLTLYSLVPSSLLPTPSHSTSPSLPLNDRYLEIHPYI